MKDTTRHEAEGPAAHGRGRAAHVVRSTFTAALLLLAVAGPLEAHGEGALAADRTSVVPGGTLELRGSKFEKGARYGLRLVGALNTYPVGEARADTTGAFTLRVTVPDSVRPGTYRLEAVAPDGDAAAKLDLTVLTRSSERTGPGAASAGHEAPSSARPDDIILQRSRGGLGWGIIGLVIGLSAGLGLGLLLGGRGA